ncbi:protein fem-1 homolog C-like [Anneissia japonica]|uniref:protein fem-1 homolog C-like n=1 Tax=Anneissia japonica TaxID=1529436 RepID=UPI001425B492|nr:protein fem-1 homolog C-like [Anneissia japonica]
MPIKRLIQVREMPKNKSISVIENPEHLKVFKSVVFQSAREGKLNKLKDVLDSLSREEVKYIVSTVTESTTPLLMACRHGHLEIVNYFIEKCVADYEQVGSVTFDGETVDGAPPLWCAAAAGHFNIVQSLIKHGANVNHTTFSNSTPLRAACFDGHYDIVKYLVQHKADIEVANRHGHTCLMISCYKGHFKIAKYLLELGANVDRKSVKGNTALHDCAESGSLEIMKLLFLRYHAKMEKDAYNMTPLLAAAVAGHRNIVDFLVLRYEICKHEKINALELMGATYIDKKRDVLQALKYWNRAMEERYKDPRKVVRKSKPAELIPAYEYAVEAESAEELENIVSDVDVMRMQALLIRERILGPAHPDTTYYIRYRGAVYADSGNFDRCIQLWMYALDMQQRVLEPLNPMTQSSLLSFAELFSYMMSERNGQRVYSNLSFVDMKTVYLKGVAEIERAMSLSKPMPLQEKDMLNFNRCLQILMHLMNLVAKLDCTPDHAQIIKRATYKLLKLHPRGMHGYTPLHLAVDKETSAVGRYPVCCFPDKNVVSLLIDCGADANAIDINRNTPLHIAATCLKDNCEVMTFLIESGSHIDSCNSDNKTALELVKGACDICPMNYITLKCLSAKIIIQHNIPYRGHIPCRLEAFIEAH